MKPEQEDNELSVAQRASVASRVSRDLSCFPMRATLTRRTIIGSDRASHSTSVQSLALPPGSAPPSARSSAAAQSDTWIPLDELNMGGAHVEQEEQWSWVYDISADPSLIYSLERTTLSAYNQSFLVMSIGVALMSIGHGDSNAVGVSLVFSGMGFGIISFGVHCRRLHNIKAGKGARLLSSVAWMGSLILLLVVGMMMELIYSYVYPLLERSQAVTVDLDAAATTPSPT